MKPLFKLFLQYYLKYITKLVLLIHRPVIVAISGSTNKTFVKNEIKKTLKEKGLDVRANPRNFNTEIGLPLAVLNLPSGYNSYRNWIPTIWQSFFCIFQKDFPGYLVLELGVSQKGDMKYLLSIVKPKISIITDITQRYLEYFSGMDDLAGEYKLLVEKTKRLIVLNHDNSRIRELAKKIHGRKKIIFLGENEEANWRISEIRREMNGESFVLKNSKNENQCRIDRFGKHHVYANVVGKIVYENLKIV